MHLDTSTTDKFLIVNMYPSIVAGLLLGAGILGDRVGRQRLFVGGLAIGSRLFAGSCFPRSEYLSSALSLQV